MQTVIDIGSHQIWQYIKTINELIKEVPKSRPGKINRKWPAARASQNSYSDLMDLDTSSRQARSLVSNTAVITARKLAATAATVVIMANKNNTNRKITTRIWKVCLNSMNRTILLSDLFLNCSLIYYLQAMISFS